MLEAIIRDLLMKHLLENKLISVDQHGFVPRRSCTTNLLECQDLISWALSKGLSVDVLYTDFSKAFDRVPHSKLITKLKQLGLGNNLVTWIEAFLTNRKQRVVMGENTSSWCDVKSGTPQGGVLSPTLFLLYINDLTSSLSNKIKLFADDGKILSILNELELAENQMQKDIDRFTEWSVKWGSHLNIEKCKIMYYGKQNPRREYFITDTQLNKRIKLDSSKLEKDLGVWISSDGKTSHQVSSAASKANKVLGCMKKAFNSYNKQIANKIYTVFVRPHLEYASTVWNPSLKSEINQLESIQRRASRANELKDKQYEDRLAALNWTSLKERRTRGDLIQIFKFAKGLDEISLVEPFFSSQLGTELERNTEIITERRQNNDNIRSQTLRSTQDRISIKREQITRNNERFKFLFNRIATVWNKLPKDIVNSPSLNSFKARLDKHMSSEKWRTSIYKAATV